MPVDILICEGKRDAEILRALCDDAPVVHYIAGGLPALAQVVLHRRDRTGKAVAGLRDRDFDAPPADSPVAVWRQTIGGEPVELGYMLLAFELENYLSGPALVDAACSDLPWWRREEYEAFLARATRDWRCYLAARRALHDARRGLPKPHEFSDRPRPDEPWLAPPEAARCREAVEERVGAFAAAVQASSRQLAVGTSYDAQLEKLADATWVETGRHLLEFPGKDLEELAGRWYSAKRGGGDKGLLFQRVRNWVLKHRDEALDRAPDWHALLATLRA